MHHHYISTNKEIDPVRINFNTFEVILVCFGLFFFATKWLKMNNPRRQPGVQLTYWFKALKGLNVVNILSHGIIIFSSFRADNWSVPYDPRFHRGLIIYGSFRAFWAMKSNWETIIWLFVFTSLIQFTSSYALTSNGYNNPWYTKKEWRLGMASQLSFLINPPYSHTHTKGIKGGLMRNLLE